MDSNYWRNHYKLSSKHKDPQMQVGRTLNKVPISGELFKKLLKKIEENLEIGREDVVLDLCCGNGLITNYLAPKCKFIVGVDFTEKLIDEMNKGKKSDNIIGIVNDITTMKFKDNSFDKILFYFSIQHISHEQTVRLFNSVNKWLKKGGLFYVGDILDNDRIWNFFNTRSREDFYFKSVENENPMPGTWYTKGFLEKLGNYANFRECSVVEQSKEFIHSHYRFDMIYKK
jgi:ubiquinone/menaquinone biosynthesis C-methylase UbiE